MIGIVQCFPNESAMTSLWLSRSRFVVMRGGGVQGKEGGKIRFRSVKYCSMVYSDMGGYKSVLFCLNHRKGRWEMFVSDIRRFCTVEFVL